MTRASAAALAAALGVCALGGCGSFRSLCDTSQLPADKAWRVYGGARLDMEEATALYRDPNAAQTGGPEHSSQALLKACLDVIDVPFSVAVDTLTLPLTATAAADAALRASVTGEPSSDQEPAPGKTLPGRMPSPPSPPLPSLGNSIAAK